MNPLSATSVIADDDSTVLLDAGVRRELLHESRENIFARLAKVIHDALDRMSEELTTLAFKKTRREEQQALLDAVSLVRTRRSEIEQNFRRAFTEAFERRLADTGAPVADERVTLAELSLVGDEAMDEQLTVDRLVRRAKTRLDPDEVLGMRARMAALVDREWFDEEQHPAAPEVVFEAIKRVLDELDPAPQVQSALLDAFEPHVSAHLNQIYKNINERLRSCQVLPRIRPRVAVAGNRKETAAPHGGQPQAIVTAVGQGAVSGPCGTGWSGMPAGAPGHPAGGGGGLGKGTAGPGMMTAAPEAGGPMALAESLASQLRAGQAGAHRSAVQFLSDPGGFGMADIPVPDVQPPLIDALNSLQADVAGARFTPILATRIVDQVRDKGSSLDQITVEIVALVFDYIYGDERLPDLFKQQLLRLQVVAIKAALLDRSFFARRQHPMRRLIDRITELANDPEAEIEPQSALVTGIATLIDAIIVSFDRDLEVFEEAIRRLDRLEASEQERRAARIAELTQRAERIDAIVTGEERARAELLARCDENTPAFASNFLEDWWSTVLTRARVEPERVGLCADTALRVAEQLLWSVAPKDADEIAQLAATLPTLIPGVLNGLKYTDIDAATRERFFNELMSWHTRTIAKAKANAERGRPRAERPVRLCADGSVHFFHLSSEPVSPVPATEAPFNEHSPVDDLCKGQLVDLAEVAGEPPMRVKVAWISPSRKLFAPSRFPDVARSVPRSEMIDMLASGQLQVVREVPVVDKAILAVRTGHASGRPQIVHDPAALADAQH